MQIHLFLKPVTKAGRNIQQYVTDCRMSLHLSESFSGIEEEAVTDSEALQDIFPAPNRFFNQLVLRCYNAKR